MNRAAAAYFWESLNSIGGTLSVVLQSAHSYILAQLQGQSCTTRSNISLSPWSEDGSIGCLQTLPSRVHVSKACTAWPRIEMTSFRHCDEDTQSKDGSHDVNMVLLKFCLESCNMSGSTVLQITTKNTCDLQALRGHGRPFCTKMKCKRSINTIIASSRTQKAVTLTSWHPQSFEGLRVGFLGTWDLLSCGTRRLNICFTLAFCQL